MDLEMLRLARRGDRASLEALLGEFYPFVSRVALALTGRLDTGNGVVRYLMKRSLHVLPKWQHDGDPLRWFSHHAILSVRRASRHAADPRHDTLRGPAPQPKYTAFLKAFRDLPPQQREAIILHDCERLDLRQTAVAMDCSTQAASNHLEAGQQALKLIAGPDYAALAAAFRRTYQALAPAEDLRLPAVRKYLRRHLWPRRLRRIVLLLLLIALLVAVWWAAQHYHLLPHMMPQ